MNLQETMGKAIGRISDLDAENKRLREAIADLLQHRVGTLPAQGWLRDNDASRKALEVLCTLSLVASN